MLWKPFWLSFKKCCANVITAPVPCDSLSLFHWHCLWLFVLKLSILQHLFWNGILPFSIFILFLSSEFPKSLWTLLLEVCKQHHMTNYASSESGFLSESYANIDFWTNSMSRPCRQGSLWVTEYRKRYKKLSCHLAGLGRQYLEMACQLSCRANTIVSGLLYKIPKI